MPEPTVPQKAPYVMEMQPGMYAWCACGMSKNQPFCDGSHRGSGMAPMRVEITEAKKVAWCGCKHAGAASKPFCDGGHRAL